MNKDQISLVIPSRNNLKYFRWCYGSIRKNGGPEVWITAADDASTDGTKEYFAELSKVDEHFKYIVNDSGKRLGHTIMFDRIIDELVDTPILGIFHSDMWLCPNALEEVLKYIKPKLIISLTRIEPPMHPPEKHKVQLDMGTEPENFNESVVLDFVYSDKFGDKTTNGVFAPWFCYKQDFLDVNGHCLLFSPQSREDDDIWNRLMLNNCDFLQVYRGYVAHLTCRGSRWNPMITTVGKESDEWLIQNNRSTRNYIRKWGSMIKHTEFGRPIITPKYNIAFVVKNCTTEIIGLIEPYCDRIYLNNDLVRTQYILDEQKATKYDMSKRVLKLSENDPNENDIIVEFDCSRLNGGNIQILQMLPDIITDSGDIGELEFDIFKFKINNMKTYEHTLIHKVEK